MCTSDPNAQPSRTNREIVVEALDFADGGIRVCLRDPRSDALALFEGLPHNDREKLAADAWTIGLRALGNAYSQARESKLEDVGKTLIGDVDRELRSHLDLQLSTIETVLKRYFDPADGEVSKRMTDFLADDGALDRALRGYFGEDHSVLAQTLARHVGASSELFRRLSPTDKEGLVQVLEDRVREVLDHNQKAVMNALDPLAEDGAVAKLLRSLRKELEDADADRGRQLQKAVAALDANDEASAISRLMRETREARRTLLEALNPEDPASPLAAVRKTVETLLEAQGKSQQRVLEDQQQRQKELEDYIRATVARMESRRQADAKSPRGGATFEDEVVEIVAVTCGDTYVVEPTGATTGLRRGCKVGDAVISFTEESAFAGCRVVVEAKRAGNYSTAKVLEEMEIARENRGAQVGVFVLSREHAWKGAPEFARYGSTLIVLWDPDDLSTDAHLKAAIVASLFMATRRRHDRNKGDITALRDIEKRVHEEVSRIARMRKANDRITSSSDAIRTELDNAERKLEILLQKAKTTLTALSVELVDEDAETSSPIVLPERAQTQAAE